jgi:hypothetical protein
MRKKSLMLILTLFLAVSTSVSQTPSSQTTAQTPDVAGTWSGTWFAYNPAQGASPPKELCKSLQSKVELKDGVWHATFEGDCGRPYKYSIKMEGRQVGKIVLFKGTTDLGEKDGGVYDWIGKATEKEFVGFYTSAFYTGVFSLTRTK